MLNQMPSPPVENNMAHASQQESALPDDVALIEVLARLHSINLPVGLDGATRLLEAVKAIDVTTLSLTTKWNVDRLELAKQNARLNIESQIKSEKVSRNLVIGGIFLLCLLIAVFVSSKV